MINGSFFIGNIIKDLDLKTYRKKATGEEGNLLMFTIAFDDGWGDNKSTVFVSLKAFDKKAKAINDFCKKGSKIAVWCKYKNGERYEKDGEKKQGHSYFIIIEVEFLTPKEKSNTQPKAESSRNVTVKELEEQQKIEEKAHENMVEEKQEQIQESDFDFEENSPPVDFPV